MKRWDLSLSRCFSLGLVDPAWDEYTGYATLTQAWGHAILKRRRAAMRQRIATIIQARMIAKPERNPIHRSVVARS